MKKSNLLIILFLILITLSGCGKTGEKNRVDGHNGYDVNVFSMPGRENMMSSIKNILEYDDLLYVCVDYYNDNLALQETVIYSLKNNGAIDHCIEMEEYQIPDCIIDGHLAFLATDNTVVLMDNDTGGLYKAINISFPEATMISSSEGGFVALGPGKIVKYNNEGEVQGVVENDDFSFFDNEYPFFERDGSAYVVVDSGFCLNYYALDFSTGDSVLVTDTELMNISINACYGQYFIDNHGEYLINLNDLKIEMMADWNDINIQPERYSLRFVPRFYVLDDFCFAKTYEYGDGTADVLIFTYNEQIDYSDREVLTVGGYGVNNDLPLRWAVYNFNTSNENYRIHLIDYSEDHSFSTGLDAPDKIAEMIQYFNQGNAPDLFYGNEFDYQSMGQSGLVNDLSDYIRNDNEFDLETISPSVRSLMIPSERECYSIFSSYALNGYWGLQTSFPTSDVSINDLESMNSSLLFWGATCSTDIADFMLRYPIMNSYSSIEDLSIDDISTMISFSIENGIPTQSQEQVVLNDFYSVSNNEYLLSLAMVGDILGYYYQVDHLDCSFTYVGFPSLNGSTHPIIPNGLIAMSSSTEHPDVCWSFMKLLLETDIQMTVAANQRIPVNQTVLDRVLEAAQDPSSIDSDNRALRTMFFEKDPIPSSVVDEYINASDSIDTITTYDWGIYNIICEEIDSYDTSGKPIDMIAESLYSRLLLYIQEMN